jgi:hypothetical protein
MGRNTAGAKTSNLLVLIAYFASFDGNGNEEGKLFYFFFRLLLLQTHEVSKQGKFSGLASSHQENSLENPAQGYAS